MSYIGRNDHAIARSHARLGLITFFFMSLLAHASYAVECPAVFPDGLSNSSASGSIAFSFAAQLLDSPDGVLATHNLDDKSLEKSCGGSPCTVSNTSAERLNFNDFPTGHASIDIGFQETRALSPGSYENITLNAQAVLTLEPGIYRVRGDLLLQNQARIEISAPGTVVIYVRGDATLSAEARVNTGESDRHLFLFTRKNISLRFQSAFNGVVYTRGNAEINSQAELNGALTAEGDIRLYFAAVVRFDMNAINSTDFDSLCDQTGVVLPEPIAEWRFDEAVWTGSSNDALDETGNGFSARATSNGGLPKPLRIDPAIAGNPGTCGYGEFNGTADGYFEVPDPGKVSVLDQPDSYTVTSWVHPFSWPRFGLVTIASKDTNWEYHLDSRGRIVWWWGDSRNRQVTSSAVVPLNEWHHIAITYESGDQRIYLDGHLVATQTATLPPATNNAPLSIGTDWLFPDRRFDGRIDEVRYYDETLSQTQVKAVMADTHDCVLANSLSSFKIDVGAGNTSVCEAEPITITAVDNTGAVMTSYRGTISLTTSAANGDWLVPLNANDAQGQLVQGRADSGSATYEFEITGADQGQIVLNLDNQRAETLSITVSDKDAGVSATSDPLMYAQKAFVVTERDPLLFDLIAGRRHQFAVELREQAPVGEDGSRCGVADNYQAASVKAWAKRSDADPGGLNPKINNFGNTDTESLQSAESSAQTVDLNFINGRAEFSVDTADVGQFSLEFLDDSLAFSDQVLRGGSQLLTARPFAFRIDVAGNPGASDQNGAVFVEAGVPFDVNVSALGWTDSDDSNDDGIADIYQDTDTANNQNLSGAVLASFGQENPSARVQLSADLLHPVFSGASSLSSDIADSNIITSFSDGTGTAIDRFYSDVGIIRIDAAVVGDYLSASKSSHADSSSGFVGRFIPSYFSLASAQFNEACASFTYLDQPRALELVVEAKNTRGQTTPSYTGVFAKLDDSLGTLNVGAIDSAMPTLLSARTRAEDLSFIWLNGVGNIRANVILQRALNLEAPLLNTSLGLAVSDEDGVGFQTADIDLDVDNDGFLDSANIGSGVYRFGRMSLPNERGPESAPLAANWQTQFWSGSAWLRSTSDNCSAIASMDVRFQGRTADALVNRSISVGAGTTTGSFSSESAGNINFASGDGGLVFSAPGVWNAGSISVDVDLSAYPWLRFDWDQDGSFDDPALPTAVFSFGSFKEHDGAVYREEAPSNE